MGEEIDYELEEARYREENEDRRQRFAETWDYQKGVQK